jgi:hypothetical protein
MHTSLLSHFVTPIRATDTTTITGARDIPASFLIAKEGALSAHYIPFDLVNSKAKVVLVGITPGLTQWKNAVAEAKRQLGNGASLEEVCIAAKRTGAFSGAMRPNLVNLLDTIGLQRWLGIDSCESLFGADSHMVHTTSVLRHPVFLDSANYNGTPGILRTPFLQQQVLDHFSKEAEQLRKALFVPLGPVVNETLLWLAQQNILNRNNVLSGLPHPSGANAERIAYFTGRKPRSTLSAKTNPDVLDAAREALTSRLGAAGVATSV